MKQCGYVQDKNLYLGIGFILLSVYQRATMVILFQPLIDKNKLKKVMDESGKTIENLAFFGGWQNNIGNMIPGKGYKVNVTSNCTLNIP